MDPVTASRNLVGRGRNTRDTPEIALWGGASLALVDKLSYVGSERPDRGPRKTRIEDRDEVYTL